MRVFSRGRKWLQNLKLAHLLVKRSRVGVLLNSLSKGLLELHFVRVCVSRRTLFALLLFGIVRATLIGFRLVSRL